MILSAVQIGTKLYAPEENRAWIEAAVRREAAEGAALVVLPELAVSGYGSDPDRLAESAEPRDGPTLDLLARLSAELKLVLVCGYCESADGALYNSAVLTAPGRAPAHYRKLHLFDREKEVFRPGDLGLVMAETDIGTIGICVCYDLRFVEVARGLALGGADLLAVPTAWVGGFDAVARDDGGYIGQARGAVVQANLNQLPMVCASQSGGDQGIRFLGSSLIADAFGTCVAGPMGEDETGVIRAEMTLEAIRAARIRSDRIRPREDRRTDTYGVSVNGRLH
ncbi:carbon-nitrogen hydrolase family protein [Roseisalinus antarcticus]|uniref:(R)-stereoselective amidase n=1 Tax=Roseisalinus antarcticus TaxID=254357 RepID=A0A1Y5TVH1_9RHOB|nr:nitrilase-related carbon-nitrogen hydrolase [Roseisalinus antarcticus]SLN70770.1 (R)-stereoselective amidase [Roseisalinus antarcticus]